MDNSDDPWGFYIIPEGVKNTLSNLDEYAEEWMQDKDAVIDYLLEAIDDGVGSVAAKRVRKFRGEIE